MEALPKGVQILQRQGKKNAVTSTRGYSSLLLWNSPAWQWSRRVCCSFCSFNLVCGKHALLPPEQQQPILSWGGHSVCMGKKKGIWCLGAVPVFTLASQILPSLSSVQEDANFKPENMEELSAIQRSAVLAEKASAWAALKPRFPCWYLFMHFKLNRNIVLFRVNNGSSWTLFQHRLF